MRPYWVQQQHYSSTTAHNTPPFSCQCLLQLKRLLLLFVLLTMSTHTQTRTGYWPSDFYKTNPAFGSEEDLRHLIKTYQANGACRYR